MIEEKRAREEKQKRDKEDTYKRSLHISNLLSLNKEKELADLKEKASPVYHKYVELGSDIKRLSGKELEALVKYICIEEKDKFSRHRANKTSMMKRLGECVPSWTSYFT